LTRAQPIGATSFTPKEKRSNLRKGSTPMAMV